MRTKEEQCRLLADAARAGEYVRLVNAADLLGQADRIAIRQHGMLQASDDGSYSVITNDPRGHGANSVSFTAAHLGFAADAGEAVLRQPSGILEITIR